MTETNGITRRGVLASATAGASVAALAAHRRWRRRARRRPSSRAWRLARRLVLAARRTPAPRTGPRGVTPTLDRPGQRLHLLVPASISRPYHITDVVNVINGMASITSCCAATPTRAACISGVAEQAEDTIAALVFGARARTGWRPHGRHHRAGDARRDRRRREAGADRRAAAPGRVLPVNEKDRAWVDALCTPHPIGTMLEPIRLDQARASASPRRPMCAPAPILTRASTPRSTGSRPIPAGASWTCRAATT